MKIIIFRADTRLGKLFAMKFRRVGHRVVSINEAEQPDDNESFKVSKDGVYLAKSQEKIADVLKYEAPDMILYFSLGRNPHGRSGPKRNRPNDRVGARIGSLWHP